MEEREKRRQEDLKRLARLRPIDDTFMRCLFKDNLPLVQLVLRIVTARKNLKLTDFETQKDLKRLGGARSVELDVYGTDSGGRKYNLEVEKSKAGEGADTRRPRYHSSVMDVENLDAGQKFSELPETSVIFIMEKDPFGEGKPFYRIERVNLDTGKLLEDGEHILYINGEYQDESTELGRLIHDFNCSDADEMYFDQMAKRTRYLKENPKGVEEMCNVMEEIRNEALAQGMAQGIEKGREEAAVAVARDLIRDGSFNLAKIASISRLSEQKIKELKAEIDAGKSPVLPLN